MKVPINQLPWAAVGMGSNQGDRNAEMAFGALALKKHSGILNFQVSSLYETNPVDCIDDDVFLNAVCCFQTELEPIELLDFLIELEGERGRKRPYPNAPRPLDLDLLLYGDVVMNSQKLTVPHPRMLGRGFVMVPLAEVGGALFHPLEKTSIGALEKKLGICEGNEGVTKTNRPWPAALYR